MCWLFWNKPIPVITSNRYEDNSELTYQYKPFKKVNFVMYRANCLRYFVTHGHWHRRAYPTHSNWSSAFSYERITWIDISSTSVPAVIVSPQLDAQMDFHHSIFSQSALGIRYIFGRDGGRYRKSVLRLGKDNSISIRTRSCALSKLHPRHIFIAGET